MEPLVMMSGCGVATLDGLMISRASAHPRAAAAPLFGCYLRLHSVYQELVARHDQPHVRSREEEKRAKEITPGYRARRGVVERSHSWINRSRRLLVRWEKKVENYLAFLHLACAQVISVKGMVFG